MQYMIVHVTCSIDLPVAGQGVEARRAANVEFEIEFFMRRSVVTLQ